MNGLRTWHGRGWRISIDADAVNISAGEAQECFVGTAAAALSVTWRWFRWQLVARDSGVRRFKGLARRDARVLRDALVAFVAEQREREAERRRREQAREAERQQREQAREAEKKRQERLNAFRPWLHDLSTWQAEVLSVIDRARQDLRWIPRERLDVLIQSKPAEAPARELRAAVDVLVLLTRAERRAVEFLDRDLVNLVAETNEQILRDEFKARKDFFDKVEKSPLTEEQARAVITFDNRVHVVAAAGSGKTSVMVARAAYAIKRGYLSADRILLLAFNKKAAEELQTRIDERLSALGMNSAGLRASTFHSFGLDVIGQATGRRPRLASWIANGQDVAMVSSIADTLRHGSPTFRDKWDLYRLLFAPLAPNLEDAKPDAYDRDSKKTGFETFAGEIVKSQGEQMVANWLYLNGVTYEYERRYMFDVADERHSQYRPDFYYPEIDVWHEHWALGRDGQPPPAFEGYAESMRWKKQIHRQFGTTLVETTWAEILDRCGFELLEKELRSFGVKFDWNPERPRQGSLELRHEDLARRLRSFMTHVKSNSLTQQSLERKLKQERRELDTYRTRLFLDIYWDVHEEWQRRLSDDGSIDFEDMLVTAVDHLENGRTEMPYDLILVDEFQDASQARARLTRALVQQSGKHLLAVGDDWQSINRFAGADLSVMTSFEEWFGRGPTLRLETTFRSPQSICDTASAFVSKNPQQLRKAVWSAHTSPGGPVSVIRAARRDDIPSALLKYLRFLAKEVRREYLTTVFVLGRYNRDRQEVMPDPRSVPKGLDIQFSTVHSAKGLEAEYVVIPYLLSGTYGFPSNISDDPVMDLVMAEPDGYPYAEERRLLYVALTRARRGVTLITAKGLESPFVVELLDGGLAEPSPLSAAVEGVIVCRECGNGFMVRRTGRYGDFLGCSTFPACRSTKQLPSVDSRPSQRGRG